MYLFVEISACDRPGDIGSRQSDISAWNHYTVKPLVLQAGQVASVPKFDKFTDRIMRAKYLFI